MTGTASLASTGRYCRPIARWEHVAHDQAADIEVFCQRVGPQLVGTLSVICGNRLVAEELTQETLIRVWDRWERVGSLDKPAAWAHRVAVNLANSWWRRVQAERRAHARIGIERPYEPDGADAVAVHQAVLQLPPRQRTVLALRYYSDLSIADTAAVMQCEPGTVKSLTSKALHNLRTRNELTQDAAHGR